MFEKNIFKIYPLKYQQSYWESKGERKRGEAEPQYKGKYEISPISPLDMGLHDGLSWAGSDGVEEQLPDTHKALGGIPETEKHFLKDVLLCYFISLK